MLNSFDYLQELKMGHDRPFWAAILTSVLIAMWTPPVVAAPFDSTADTVFDIVQTQDPSKFVCLSYQGRALRQMWDKRLDNEFDYEVFLFEAHFTDSPPFSIIVNPEFETKSTAEIEVRRYTRELGQLPLTFRHGIRQFGIHKGTPTYSGGPGKIFVYADKTTQRIAENHLEESLLHEAIHATLDAEFARSPEWSAAQQSDGEFITDYAKRHPNREDLAESALFSYGLIVFPGRIPPVDSAVIEQTIPARLAFFSDLLSQTPQVLPAPPLPENCN